MESFLFGVQIGASILTVVLAIFLPIVLVYFLAKNNIFFTIVQEGTAKAILKFGKFHKIIMIYTGYQLDANWEVRSENEKDKNGKDIKFQPKPLRIGGLVWVGIPFVHSVYRYNFTWVSFEQREEGGKLVEKTVSHTEEKIDYILVQDDVYYSFIKEAETDGMVPVDVDMLLTIGITNPYKALFRIQNWLEVTFNRAKPALRDFVRKSSFENLIKQGADEFLEGTKVDEALKNEYGVNLKKVGIVNIDPAGDKKAEYAEAATKEWLAQKDHAQIKTLADAEVDRMDRVYKKIVSYKEAGLFIRMTEALEEAGRGPSNLIFPFGSIQSMLKGWFEGGNKK